jgi:vacuolar-type H+-ATPase subunit I/STV1
MENHKYIGLILNFINTIINITIIKSYTNKGAYMFTFFEILLFYISHEKIKNMYYKSKNQFIKYCFYKMCFGVLIKTFSLINFYWFLIISIFRYYVALNRPTLNKITYFDIEAQQYV